tara:strand:- start:203 stop:571 length:369 start_codon:yes stop_codon:yes gene_type:complete
MALNGHLQAQMRIPFLMESSVGKKRSVGLKDAPEGNRTLGKVSADAESALTDLDGALTAARALVELTLSDGGANESRTLYKRLNALEFVLRCAGFAEDVLWIAIDQMSMSVDHEAPAPLSDS